MDGIMPVTIQASTAAFKVLALLGEARMSPGSSAVWSRFATMSWEVKEEA